MFWLDASDQVIPLKSYIIQFRIEEGKKHKYLAYEFDGKKKNFIFKTFDKSYDIGRYRYSSPEAAIRAFGITSQNFSKLKKAVKSVYSPQIKYLRNGNFKCVKLDEFLLELLKKPAILKKLV
jgi:hypothetical protein